MQIFIDDHRFDAILESEKSPASCAAFSAALPFASQVIHVRWSGEAIWIPLGELIFAVGYEDATAYPSPGQILLYPRGKSETEILIAYGDVHFASKAGTLAGNHFATITSNLDQLREIGIATLWQGAKAIRFEN